MTSMKLFFLGSPCIDIEEAASGVASRKAFALLAYLAVTARPHSREHLAALFWPEVDHTRALGSLRYALTTLRKTLGGQWILADNDTLALDPEQDIWLDVLAFQDELGQVRSHEHPPGQTCDDCLPHLLAAASLYQGDFLAGFGLRDCPEFDDWQFFKREGLKQDVAGVLERLAMMLSSQGDHDGAIPYARRWLALDPLHEPAHRALMLLYAQAGQRAAALRQYEECRRVLEDELVTAPEDETRILVEKIKRGDVDEIEPIASLPFTKPVSLHVFLTEDASSKMVKPLFVAREQELAWLSERLSEAYQGQGQVVFVTGEAGAGKTMLVNEFVQQSLERHPDLLVAMGQCNAFAGIGDPYLPFRQIMDMLAGDVESRYLAGALSTDHARRLWQALPETAATILEHGHDLPSVFMSGSGILKRLQVAAPEETKLLAEFKLLLEQGDLANAQQAQLLDQYGRVLKDLGEQGPLLLVLDDLQWTDTGSANLLFQLGRELSGHPILLLGIYRPDEVDAGRNDQRHPLSKPLAELRRLYGDTWLKLNQISDEQRRAFVDALIDSEPNQLSPTFRQALYQHTEGHALFTVELLRDLQERGDLVWTEDTGWRESARLDWQEIPARVEGIIEERISRLESELCDLLTIASVEGEDFTAQVIARVREANERNVVRQLSQELDRKHRLVKEQGVEQLGRERMFHYRFRHSLFQQHLYNGMSEIERRLLHDDVGAALEALYGDDAMDIAPQLAFHFSKAGNGDKALPYLLEAANRARVSYAHQEAERFYLLALNIQQSSGHLAQAADTLMNLGLNYYLSSNYERAQQAYAESFSLREQTGLAIDSLAHFPAPHALRFLRVDDGLPFDPMIDWMGTSYLLFSGLVKTTPDLRIMPDIAQRWEIHDDGHTYTLHLRDDVVWSDGVPVTAGDFEFGIKRLLQPNLFMDTIGSPLDYMGDICGVRAAITGQDIKEREIGIYATDDQTLVIKLDTPVVYFLHLLALPIFYPVPRHLVKKHGEQWSDADKVVTCGRFLLDAFEPGEYLSLIRNPHYHEDFTGNVDRVEVSFRPQPRSRQDWLDWVTTYDDDAVDVMNLRWFLLAPLEELKRKYGSELHFQAKLNMHELQFSTQLDPCRDHRVRKAMGLAIDRSCLGDVLTAYAFGPAKMGLLPPQMPGFSSEAGFSFDPEAARRLVARAGYPGSRGFLTIRVVLPENLSDNLGVWQRSQWHEHLGLDVELRNWQGSLLSREYEIAFKKYHVGWGGWIADYPDPDSHMRVNMIQKSQLTGWNHEEYFQLVEQARYVTDLPTRLDIYRKAEDILENEVPVIPLSDVNEPILIKPWVVRYPLSSGVRVHFLEDVVIEPH